MVWPSATDEQRKGAKKAVPLETDTLEAIGSNVVSGRIRTL